MSTVNATGEVTEIISVLQLVKVPISGSVIFNS